MTRRRASERQGEAAAEIVARQFDLEVRNDVAEWYDAVDPGTGTKYEVKSTHTTLENEAEGRFRLWEDQHRSLLSADASGTAWYAFVLFSEDDDVLGVQRRRPSTVTTIVREVGEGDPWSLARHRERDSRQKKVPWSAVMEVSNS